jgi:hypothetical protein
MSWRLRIAAVASTALLAGALFVPIWQINLYSNQYPDGLLVSVNATGFEAGQNGADLVEINTLNPGAIATNLQKHTGGLRTPEERRKTPAQGAATSVLLAASPLVAGISGRYFEDCNEAMHVTVRPDDYVGVAPYALDPANAERLWELATRWVT